MRRSAGFDGNGEFDRFCARVRKADRDFNIEPPASPYAIVRRAYPPKLRLFIRPPGIAKEFMGTMTVRCSRTIVSSS